MICEICGEGRAFSYTDFHGQVTCMTCGAPYQIKDFSGAPKDLKYPYLDLAEKFVPVFKEYWEKTKKRCRLGLWLAVPQDIAEERKSFKEWLRANHPEQLSKGK